MDQLMDQAIYRFENTTTIVESWSLSEDNLADLYEVVETEDVGRVMALRALRRMVMITPRFKGDATVRKDEFSIEEEVRVTDVDKGVISNVEVEKTRDSKLGERGLWETLKITLYHPSGEVMVTFGPGPYDR